MAEKSDKKSKRSRKKSKSTDDDVDFDDEFVDRQLKMAEQQMERAMGQMRLAGKAAKTAAQLEAQADKMWGDKDSQAAKTKGVTINHYGTQINIQAADNIQVGSHNTMVVMNNSGKNKKPSRRRKSYDSEEEEIIDRTQQNHNKHDSIATENDQLVEEILKSERIVTPQDLDLASRNIGSDWRRFLRFLGLDDSLLSQLHQDYYVEGIRQVVSQGLIMWKRRNDKQATLGVLTSTLKKVGYGDVVKEFKL